MMVDRVSATVLVMYFMSSVHTSTAVSNWLPNITEWQSTILPVTSSYTMDTAELYIKSTVDDVILYMWQNTECDKCDLFQQAISSQGNWSQRAQTAFPNRFQVVIQQPQQNVTFDNLDPTRLTDHGVYWLIVSRDSSSLSNFTVELVLANSPVNPDLPVLYAFLVLLGLAVLWVVISFFVTRYDRVLCRHNLTNWSPSQDAATVQHDIVNKDVCDTHDDVTSESVTASDVTLAATNQVAESKTASSSPAAPVKRRLKSLDSFRGLSLTIMIFVNYGGGGYWYFEHAVWNGLMVADIVFPWFIFIMGTSMAFSFRSLFNQQIPTWRIVWKIIWRAVKLFALGLFLGTKYNNNLQTIRIPGVLQRFSITYLVVALVHLPFAKYAHRHKISRRLRLVADIFPFILEWIIMLAILSMFLALTYALPVPDCPTGYVGPGGLHDSAQHYNCTGGAAGYIDRYVLTENHIYLNPTPKEIYQTVQGFDPEGILGTLTSIFLCYLGLQAGKIIQCYKDNDIGILVRWTVWGVITGAIALVLCEASVNDGWVPLNKNLWSVSYILAMASTSYLLLAVMYIVIDVFHIWNGSPFTYPGMNSIVIYFCQSAFSTNFPVSWQMPDMQSHWQKLLLAIWGSAFWTVTAYILYLKKIFVAL